MHSRPPDCPIASVMRAVRRLNDAFLWFFEGHVRCKNHPATGAPSSGGCMVENSVNPPLNRRNAFRRQGRYLVVTFIFSSHRFYVRFNLQGYYSNLRLQSKIGIPIQSLRCSPAGRPSEQPRQAGSRPPRPDHDGGPRPLAPVPPPTIVCPR